MEELRSDMHYARDLIRQHRYEDARQILNRIDHPVAHAWLNSLDELTATTHRRRSRRPADLVPEAEENLLWLEKVDIDTLMPSSAKQRRNTWLLLGVLGSMMCAIMGLTAALAYVGMNITPEQTTTADIIGKDAPFRPYIVEITDFGNDNSARNISGQNCAGWTSENPNHIVQWPADSGDTLRVQATSNIDTILLIQDPAGKWWCDDDSGDDFNPMLRFPAAIAGSYEVYIGPWEREEEDDNATLSISVE